MTLPPLHLKQVVEFPSQRFSLFSEELEIVIVIIIVIITIIVIVIIIIL